MNVVVGARLVRNAAFTVRVIERGVFLKPLKRSGRMIGVRRIVSVRSVRELMSRVVFTTFTWSCTKMDGS